MCVCVSRRHADERNMDMAYGPKARTIPHSRDKWALRPVMVDLQIARVCF